MPDDLKGTSWFKGIQIKVILRFLPIIILVPILLAVVTYLGQKKSVIKIAEEHLNSVVTLKSRGLDKYFTSGRESLMISANAAPMRELGRLKLEGKAAERRKRQIIGSLRGFLRGAVRRNTEFEELSILDPEEGRVIISSELKNEGKIFGDRIFFKKGLERAFTDKIRTLPGDDGPTVYSAVPIASFGGLPGGVLVGRHNMMPVMNLMAELSGLGETADTYLFDEHFLLIHQSNQKNQKSLRRQIVTGGTRKTLEEKSGVGIYQGPKSKMMVGSFQYLGGLGVGLIAEERLTEALKPLYDLKENLALAAIIITLFALLALWFISKQIVKPLSRLSRAVTRFSDGNFSTRADVQSQDEIGRLSQNFNTMASSLEKLYGSLEEQVKKRTEELVNSLLETEEARAEWEDTFHAMSDALFIYDEKGAVRRLNTSAEEMIQKKEIEVRGRMLQELLPIVPKPDENGCYPGSVKITDEKTNEIYRISHFTKRDSKGVLRGGVFVYRNITEDIKREKEYKDVQAQLLEASKLAAVGTLSAGVAHEFNNLIAGIRLHADLALNHKTSDKMERALNIAVESSERAAKIISSLLVFSRRKSSERTPGSLEEVVNETLGIIEADFQARGIELVKNFEKLKLIQIDKGQISQVVLNLLTNARDAVLKNENPKIQIKIYNEGKWAVLEVRDNGVGIKDEDVQKIFEPFFTTKGILGGGTKSAPGTGLGLSISYGIIQSHGGFIDVRSERGTGTSFMIKLPLVEKEEVPEKKESVVKREERETIEKKEILVVDDEEPIRNAIKEAMEGAGHKVWVAKDGREGLQMINQIGPDIIFLDLLMPGLSGPELIQKIDFGKKKSKIIAMSGVVLEDIDSLFKLGVQGFLKKPFKISELEEKFYEVAKGE